MKKAFLTIALMSAAMYTFAQTGVIRELSGVVEIQPAGAAAFVPATVGSVITQDTIVSTGFRSNAIIDVGSSTLTVRPLTRLSLTEIQTAAGAETLTANLQAGRVRVDVRPPAGTTAQFTMHGPSATASVRGTSFEIDVHSVRVTEGSVFFAGNVGAPVIVNVGGESTAAAGAAAVNPLQQALSALSPLAPAGAGASGEVVAGGGTLAILGAEGNVSLVVNHP